MTPYSSAREGKKPGKYDPVGILSQAVPPNRLVWTLFLQIYYCPWWPEQSLSHQSRLGSCHRRAHTLLKPEFLRFLDHHICVLGVKAHRISLPGRDSRFVRSMKCKKPWPRAVRPHWWTGNLQLQAGQGIGAVGAKEEVHTDVRWGLGGLLEEVRAALGSAGR